MYIEILYRIRAAPVEYLGCKSLLRLEAFDLGYSSFGSHKIARYDIEGQFTDWVRRRYGYVHSTLGFVQILMEVSQANEEKAFDLFFSDLDLFTTSHPDSIDARGVLDQSEVRQPVSWFVEAVLANRPAMYLSWITVGGLRAAIDGYTLAVVDAACLECADLDGWEEFLRGKLNLSGLFRWENVILARSTGDQRAAYEWSIQQIRAFVAVKNH
jgi:hypothetical protein